MEKTTNEKKYLILGMISTFVLGFALGGIFTTLNSEDTASRYNINDISSYMKADVEKPNSSYSNEANIPSNKVKFSIEDLNKLNLLDINGDNKVDMSDHELINLYLFGFDLSNTITNKSIYEIENDLDKLVRKVGRSRSKLDLDMDGKVDALSDGIILARFITLAINDGYVDESIFDGVRSRGSRMSGIEYFVKYMKGNFRG